MFDSPFLDQPAGEMRQLIERLFPICRSITGDGVRKTLGIVGEQIPLKLIEVPTGTQVFDWVVPREWNIRDAWIKGPNGEKVLDFAESNLHVVGYSVPVRKKVSLEQLGEHVVSLSEQPELIPYRTSYYKETWGFCLQFEKWKALAPGEYEVCIDSELSEGHLSYAECFVQGDSEEEVLISAHVCHPSLANDNLSGVALAVQVAKALRKRKNRLSYRFLFMPGTIGAIAWLKLNESRLSCISHGLVLTCVGDGGPVHYKQSRDGNALIDRAMRHVMRQHGNGGEIMEFSPYGYDERQFCSPGINLPVGVFMRSVHGTFPEYHTSADNLDFIREESLADSLKCVLEAIEILEEDRTFESTNPKCEPMLGRRGLYSALGADTRRKDREMALLWVLNQSDGLHSLLDIAERAKLEFRMILGAARALEDCGLLRSVEKTRRRR